MSVNLKFQLAILAILTGLVISVPRGRAGYIEDWDTGNNQWYYYDENVGDGDVALGAVQSGGEDGGAYVEAPFDSMTEWSEIPGVWWGPYTYGDDGGSSVHPIDLNEDPVSSIYGRDETSPGNVDLKGGAVHFWIGRFYDPDGPGGPTSPLLTFFHYDDTVKITDTWSPTRQVIRSNPGRWTELVNDENLDPIDLFDEPQQWGFGIFGASDKPTGVLGFDSLANTPEPAAAILLLLGALLALNRRRR